LLGQQRDSFEAAGAPDQWPGDFDLDFVQRIPSGWAGGERDDEGKLMAHEGS
jgi:hypothetical protein